MGNNAVNELSFSEMLEALSDRMPEVADNPDSGWDSDDWNSLDGILERSNYLDCADDEPVTLTLEDADEVLRLARAYLS